jgi:hypothetical protein
MHLTFLETALENGDIEITLSSGAEELEKAIAGEFTMPKKLVLSGDQKSENLGGLMDLISGAFCFQGIMGVTFTVKNAEGEELYEYKKSLYDGLGGPGGASPDGPAPCGPGGDAPGGHGGDTPGDGGCCGSGEHH